jgi:hypothetical protein
MDVDNMGRRVEEIVEEINKAFKDHMVRIYSA